METSQEIQTTYGGSVIESRNDGLASITLLEKLKALRGIDKLSTWDDVFVDELWVQTKHGTDDQFIDNSQAYTLRNLHGRYFGEMK